jgi:hypothetical protein
MIEKIREILKGIDKDISQDKDGWWETSTGAEFGAKKLKEIEDLVKNCSMTIEEFNKTRFRVGMTMRLHKSDELKIIVSVDFEEALIAYLDNDFDNESISWVRCENVTIE